MKVMIAEKRRALEEFRDLLASQGVDEATWQHFFASTPFVLTESLPVRLSGVYSQVRLDSGIPDFVFCEPNGLSPLLGYHGVIELKKPEHNILRVYSTRHLSPSRHLVDASNQAKRYLEALGRGSVLDKRYSLSIGGSGYAFIIIGQSREVIERCHNEMLASNYRQLLPGGFQIIPYDSLLNLFGKGVPERLSLFVVRTGFAAGVTNLRDTWMSEMGKERGVWTAREEGEPEAQFRRRHEQNVSRRLITDPPQGRTRHEEW